MKNIQSQYVVWTMCAVFSMNAAVPVLPTDPKQETLSFVQRISLIRIIKKARKEWADLHKKVEAGTATEEEKQLLKSKKFGYYFLLFYFFIFIPALFFWARWSAAKNKKRLTELKKRRQRFEDERSMLEKEELQVLLELKAALVAKSEALEADLKGMNIRVVAQKFLLGEITKDQAIENLIYEVKVTELSGEGSEELYGMPRERAEAVLAKEIKKIDKELLEEKF